MVFSFGDCFFVFLVLGVSRTKSTVIGASERGFSVVSFGATISRLELFRFFMGSSVISAEEKYGLSTLRHDIPLRCCNESWTPTRPLMPDFSGEALYHGVLYLQTMHELSTVENRVPRFI